MRLQLTIAALVLASLCGCKKADTPEDPSTDSANQGPAKPAITVATKNSEELEELIAGHKGKIVIVDLWTRSSEPCLAELPQLQALQEKYSDDVAAISLNLDHTEGNVADEAARKKVLAKLTELKMNTINVMSSETRSDVLGEQGLFGIPAVIVYDRNGKFHKCFDGEGFNFELQIFPLIEVMVSLTEGGNAGTPEVETQDTSDKAADSSDDASKKAE